MQRISIDQAIKLLENDKTAHKVTIYFAVSKYSQDKYNLDTVEINGEQMKVVSIDAGKCSDIKQTVLNLGCESLMNGIYARIPLEVI